MLDELTIEVDPPLRKVRRFLVAVEKEVIEEAEVDTYNRLIGLVRTHTRRTIARTLKINQRLVNARAALNKATRRFPTARYALGTLFHIPARYLNPRQFKAGVRYRRATGQLRTKPGTFIVPGRRLRNIGEGGRAAERSFVFERAGPGRLPIRQVGVRIERLVLLAFARASRELLPRAGDIYAKQFEFRAQRAVDRYLGRRARR